MSLRDWLPTSPFRGPPIPHWLTKNPGRWESWTSPEEYVKVAEKAGDWATARSAAMLSKADIMAGRLDNFAENMYSRMMFRLGAVPAPTIAPPRRKKKEKVTEVVRAEAVTEEAPEEVTPITAGELEAAKGEWLKSKSRDLSRLGDFLMRLRRVDVDTTSVEEAVEAYQEIDRVDYESESEFREEKEPAWEEVLEAVRELEAPGELPPTELKKARVKDLELLTGASSNWRRVKKAFPGVVDIEDIAKEKGFELSDAQIRKIVKVLEDQKPLGLEEVKAPVEDWIKSARAPGEWPSEGDIINYTRIEYHGLVKLTDEMAAKWLADAQKGGQE